MPFEEAGAEKFRPSWGIRPLMMTLLFHHLPFLATPLFHFIYQFSIVCANLHSLDKLEVVVSDNHLILIRRFGYHKEEEEE